MDEKNPKRPSIDIDPLNLPKWYYFLLFVLVALSVVTLNRNFEGKWEIMVGIREVTPILVALAILPYFLKFFKRYEKGGLKLPGVEVSWERKSQIDKEIDKVQEQHYEAGKAALDPNKTPKEIEVVNREADDQLINSIKPNELPVLQNIYIQELYELVKAFNQNRRLPFTDERTVQGDEIAYRMRTLAPLLFEKFNVEKWLSSSNIGKRLAAIKYLDWAEDIEFFEDLLSIFSDEIPFMQFHIKRALYNMIDQLNQEQQDSLKDKLNNYNPPSDSSRAFWKKLILDRIITKK